MSNIQKTMDSLQPYVIGIRYVQGVPLVDVVYKEGWTVPEDKNIKKVKGDEAMNYYMIFSEVEGVGLDELLADVERTIKFNQEREKKHELLKAKVNELKELFKKHPLTKLTKLKFVLGEEDLVPDLNDFDVDDELGEMIPESNHVEEPPVQDMVEEEIPEPTFTEQSTYLDENGQPIEMSEEEREILEEEARAERNRAIMAKKKEGSVSKIASKVELPPKRKIQMAINEQHDYDTDCECGPNEACDKCIDKKDL
jgi:hypothetical protein